MKKKKEKNREVKKQVGSKKKLAEVKNIGCRSKTVLIKNVTLRSHRTTESLQHIFPF